MSGHCMEQNSQDMAMGCEARNTLAVGSAIRQQIENILSLEKHTAAFSSTGKV